MSTATATMSATPPPPSVTPLEEAGSTSDLENIATSPSTRRSEDSNDAVNLKFRPSLETVSQTSNPPQLPFKVNQAARFSNSDRWTMVKVKVSFDVTRKGERSLVIDGFKFTKSRDGMADRVFWRCSRRECKATAVTVADRVEHVRAIHEHTPPLASEFFGGEATIGEIQEVRFNTCPGGGSNLKNRHRRRTSVSNKASKADGEAVVKTPSNSGDSGVRQSFPVPKDLTVPITPRSRSSNSFNEASLIEQEECLSSPNIINAHQHALLTGNPGAPPPMPTTYIGVVNNGTFVPSSSTGSSVDPRSSLTPQNFYQASRMLHPFLLQQQQQQQQQQLYNPTAGTLQDSLPLNLEVQRLIPGSTLRTSPPPGHTAQEYGNLVTSPHGQSAVERNGTPEPQPGECKRRQLEQMALQLLRETGGWVQSRPGQFIANSKTSPLYSPSSVSQSRWQTQDSIGSSGEFSPRVSPRSTPVGQEQRSAGHINHSILHWKKEKIKESVEEEENTRKRRRSEAQYSETNATLHDCQKCWDKIKGSLLNRLIETVEIVGNTLQPVDTLDDVEHRCRVLQQCVSTIDSVKRLKFSTDSCSIGSI